MLYEVITGILAGPEHLQPVADDAGVGQHPLQPGVGIAGHFGGVETGEQIPVITSYSIHYTKLYENPGPLPGRQEGGGGGTGADRAARCCRAGRPRRSHPGAPGALEGSYNFV